MQEHLLKILNKFSLRWDLINENIIDTNTFIFIDGIENEERWNYYHYVCKELKIKDKVIRYHGMNSELASQKKREGHKRENDFKLKYGFEVKSGQEKADLIKDGEIYASLKGGKKIQYGMHVLNNTPEKIKELFSDWVFTYKNNLVSFNERLDIANKIIQKLQNSRELRYYWINWFCRKYENLPYIIIRDVKNGEMYYRISYDDLINVIVDNINFYTTKGTIKINTNIDLGEKKRRVLFEFEIRKDKKNLLMHGTSEVIIKIIKKYKIDVKEIYKIK
jgi:hypothetical protein